MAEDRWRWLTNSTVSTAVPHEAGHAKVFPPLDPGTFAPQLIWLALTFGLLYLLLKRFSLPRVGEVIEERRERIQRDLGQAEKLKAETEQALANYERALGEARGKAQAIVKGMRDKLAAEVDTGARRARGADRRQAGRCGGPHRPDQGQGAGRRQRHRRRACGRHRSRLIGREVSKDEVQKALVNRQAAE